MTKEQIRAKALINLKTIPSAVKVNKSKKASDKLIELAMKYKSISIFESFDWEIDTKDVIEHLTKYKRLVSVPKILPTGEMIMIDRETRLEVKKDSIELIIIPCVAFYKNQRIGYGRGNYDRYLKDFKGKKVLYAFKEQKMEFIPDETDIPFDDKIIE